jgi:membrane-bound lytic murein transglycosylase B
MKRHSLRHLMIAAACAGLSPVAAHAQPGAPPAANVPAAPVPRPLTPQPTLPSVPFADFLPLLHAELVSRGVPVALSQQALTGLSPDLDVVNLLHRQPEHDRTTGQYVSMLVSLERIGVGRQRMAEQAATLATIEARFGVDRHVVAAVWGVETTYGEGKGDRPVVRSLATLAFADSRRPQFWREELAAALKIVQAGDIPLEALNGSWAGAMGHTQFMPTTYLRHAADFDGDGKRDIWRSAGDALASTANYLKASGWTKGQPWGFQVILPSGFDFGHSAPGRSKRAADWQALGVSTPAGEPWPATSTELSLLLPSGASGPAFLVTTNFRSILRYNASTSYALSIGLLANALESGEAPKVTWPQSDRALTRAEREELQRLLTGAGHDTGAPDGIIGSQTRAAIRNWQRSQSLPQDGHPSEGVLVRLRGTSSQAPEAFGAPSRP